MSILKSRVCLRHEYYDKYFEPKIEHSCVKLEPVTELYSFMKIEDHSPAYDQDDSYKDPNQVLYCQEKLLQYHYTLSYESFDAKIEDACSLKQEVSSDHPLKVEGSLSLENDVNDIMSDHPHCFVKAENNNNVAPLVKHKTDLRLDDNIQSKPSAPRPGKMVRNYAQAICTFASSHLAVPYLETIIDRDYPGKMEISSFQTSIKAKKKNTFTIAAFRDLLLVHPTDCEYEVIHKKLFAEIAEVFIKYFSVNWIFGSKVRQRDEHLKCRYKMLRRIRDPEHFTYLTSKIDKRKNDDEEI